MTIPETTPLTATDRLYRLMTEYTISSVDLNLAVDEDGLYIASATVLLGDAGCHHIHDFRRDTGHGFSRIVFDFFMNPDEVSLTFEEQLNHLVDEVYLKTTPLPYCTRCDSIAAAEV